MEGRDKREMDDGKTLENETDKQALLTGYGEICKSYHAIDDFRMKLLGFLPLTSLLGIFGISSKDLPVGGEEVYHHLVVFIGIFAAAFTLALFIYEIRGILRCNDLIYRGRDIEMLLKVKGQFFVCLEAHECKRSKLWVERTISLFDAKLAACVIYSTVIAAWVFMVLRMGFNIPIYGCAFTALGSGVIFGVSAFLLVKKLVAA